MDRRSKRWKLISMVMDIVNVHVMVTVFKQRMGTERIKHEGESVMD